MEQYPDAKTEERPSTSTDWDKIGDTAKATELMKPQPFHEWLESISDMTKTEYDELLKSGLVRDDFALLHNFIKANPGANTSSKLRAEMSKIGDIELENQVFQAFLDYGFKNQSHPESITHETFDPTAEHLVDKLFSSLTVAVEQRGGGIFNSADSLDGFYFGEEGKGRLEKIADIVKRPFSAVSDEFRRNFSEVKPYNGLNAGQVAKFKKNADVFGQNSSKWIEAVIQRGLVGEDAAKVWMTPSEMVNNYYRPTNAYRHLQETYSRANGKDGNLIDFELTDARCSAAAWAIYEDHEGHAHFQDVDIKDTQHYIDETGGLGYSFMHVNSDQEEGLHELRCYITPDFQRDPATVLEEWRNAVENSELRGKLYFKYFTGLQRNIYDDDPNDDAPQRLDQIVVFLNDKIPDDAFRNLLKIFKDHTKGFCAPDENHMPPAATAIANGISIAAEPSYINDYIVFSGNEEGEEGMEGRHSWTTFVDNALGLSVALAHHRLDGRINSVTNPEMNLEIKKAFREFMILSYINPKNMLAFDQELPSWTKI